MTLSLFSGSFDPLGLLDIASFICSRVFSIVNVRQIEREQGNPLLPRGIWKKDSSWTQTFSLLPCSSEWTHHAPLPAFTHLSPHVFPWRLAHFIFYMMNVSLNLLWRLSELLLYHRFQPRRDSSNGNYRGICCITKHIPCWGFHMYTAFLFRDQHLRKIHLFVLIYSILQLQQPLQLFHLCIERGLYE